jgi:hypothetical protein
MRKIGTMKNTIKSWMSMVVASLLVLALVDPRFALALSSEEGAQSPQESQATTRQSSPQPAETPATPQSGASTNPSVEELPDSPGAVSSSSRNASQDAASQGTAAQDVAPAQTPPVGQQKPVGTAAAEAPSVRGTGASKPAGFAIAPGKQRQSRSFLIKVGAVIGAGAALGTVMALSMASSSKPPGAK